MALGHYLPAQCDPKSTFKDILCPHLTPTPPRHSSVQNQGQPWHLKSFRERMDSPAERSWEGCGLHWQTVGDPGGGKSLWTQGSQSNSCRALRLQTSSDMIVQDPCPQALPHVSGMEQLCRAEVLGKQVNSRSRKGNGSWPSI